MTPDPEELEEELFADGIEHRVERATSRRGYGRRATDTPGWTVRSGDLAMLVAVLAIITPLFGVAFYVRDIATQVATVVSQQAIADRRAEDHEQRIKALEAASVRLDGGATQRQAAVQDHEQRIRALEMAN